VSDGLPGCLSKLPAQLMRGPDHLLRFDLLREPMAARVLWHVERITPDLLTLLDRLDPIVHKGAFVAFLKTPKAAEVIDHLLAIVLRWDPSPNRVAVLPSLAAVASPQAFENWFARWLERCPVSAAALGRHRNPAAADLGGRTVRHAFVFQNCLKSRLGRILASAAYYYVGIEHPVTVIELARAPLAGWMLGEIGARPTPRSVPPMPPPLRVNSRRRGLAGFPTSPPCPSTSIPSPGAVSPVL
jgi:hypothetical protein